MSTAGKKTIKNTNIWSLYDMFLHNQKIMEEIKREIKTCIEIKREIKTCIETNENTTTSNLSDSVNAVLRGRFTEIKAYLKKRGKHQINT